MIQYEHRNGEKTLGCTPPVKFDSIDVNIRHNYPLVGEDSAGILQELGYSYEEIDILESKKVIQK